MIEVFALLVSALVAPVHAVSGIDVPHSVTHGAASHHVSAAPAPRPAGFSSPDVADVPGVPRSFAACVAFRESTNGTNAAYNGGVYGIITASGVNVNGKSLAEQKQAFSKMYQQYGGKPWAADGCPGTD